MVPHWGLQGTSKPSHYHVVHNDAPELTKDELQRFTFDLCFLYARATKIVSRPAPVYYAHLAAFQAQYFKEGYTEQRPGWDDSASVASGGSGGGASVASSSTQHAKVLEFIKTTLPFC